MGTGHQAVAVVAVTAVYTACLFAVVHRVKGRVVREPLVLPFVAFVWTLAAVAVAASVVATNDSHDAGGPATWFSAGWNTGLAIFGIRVDTWTKYALVLNYQNTRAIIGSMLSNTFYAHLTVHVQGGSHDRSRTSSIGPLLAAQAAASAFLFFARVTDTFLFLAQFDISLVALIVGMGCVGMITYAFAVESPEAQQPKAGARARLRM